MLIIWKRIYTPPWDTFQETQSKRHNPRDTIQKNTSFFFSSTIRHSPLRRDGPLLPTAQPKATSHPGNWTIRHIFVFINLVVDLGDLIINTMLNYMWKLPRVDSIQWLIKYIVHLVGLQPFWIESNKIMNFLLNFALSSFFRPADGN